MNFLAAADSVAPDISAIFTTALTSIQGNVVSYVGIALPIALGIFGLFLSVRLVIHFFKGTVK